MEIEQKVLEIFKENLDFEDDIVLEAELVNDLNIGSFDRIMIINAIEDAFSMVAEEEEVKGVKTIQDVVDLVKIYKK